MDSKTGCQFFAYNSQDQTIDAFDNPLELTFKEIISNVDNCYDGVSTFTTPVNGFYLIHSFFLCLKPKSTRFFLSVDRSCGRPVLHIFGKSYEYSSIGVCIYMRKGYRVKVVPEEPRRQIIIPGRPVFEDTGNKTFKASKSCRTFFGGYLLREEEEDESYLKEEERSDFASEEQSDFASEEDNG